MDRPDSPIERVARVALLLGALLVPTLAYVGSAGAEDVGTGPVLIDRVVVRWYAPELGGPNAPRVIFERELAFEARLEALADRFQDAKGYAPRHIRAALDRHIAEVLLANLPVFPEPEPEEVATRAEEARLIMTQRVGGTAALVEAARTEGMTSTELDALLRRRARASLYVDRMVAPMLEPSDLELREVFESGNAPWGPSRHDFTDVRDQVERWLVAQRLRRALESYYQNARGRVRVVVVAPQ